MTEQQEKEKLSIGKFFNLTEVGQYFFRKKGDRPKGDFNLRAMHFINKFSIIVFLCAVIYLIIKNVVL